MDTEEATGDPTNSDFKEVASEEEFEIIDGKRHRCGRITATSLKRLRGYHPELEHSRYGYGEV